MNYRDEIPSSHEPERSDAVVRYQRQELVATQIVAGVADDFDDNASQFWRILQVLLRRRWTILAVLILGLSYAGYSALRSTPLYSAVATLEVQPQESQVIEGGNVQPLAVADAEFMSTQYELIKSRALAERVAEEMNLVADARYADQAGSLPERLTQAAGYINNALSVGAVARSRIIELRVQGPDAAETARIANAVAEGFIQMNLERHYNATTSAGKFLEERLKITKASLEDAERKLVQYSRDNGIVDMSSVGGSEIGSSLDASSLVALNASFTTAQEARLVAEQKLRAAQADPAAILATESLAAATLRQTLSELTAQYRQLSSTFLPDYPAMKELDARIGAIRENVELEQANRMATLDSEYRAALAREAGLLRRVDELKEQVQLLRVRSIDYNILAREVDTLRANYDALLQRFKEITIVGGVVSSQVSVLDKAQTPIVPFAPSVWSSFLRVILASLLAGIVLALAIDYIDDTIKTPEDVKKKLKLPVIGVIPRVKERASSDRSFPRSIAAEAFASARIALQFATSTGPPRTLLVTGVRPSEGKTSTIVGLALAFVGTGKRVLIIDADMRQPSFSALGQNQLGLSGLLTSNERLADHFIPAETPNLFLLPAGTPPPNPAELLSGPRISELMEDARGLFDMVLVDSPPILNFADGPVLSSVCDGTILVLQAGVIRGPVARRAIERLVGANGHVLGALLTKAHLKKADYGYGYSSKNSGRRGFAGSGRKPKIEILAKPQPIYPNDQSDAHSP